MATGNLTRDEARARSAALRIEGYDVEVDVSGAPDPDRSTFPVRATATFRSAVAATFLDFLDGEVTDIVVNGEAVAVRYDGDRILLDHLRTDAPNVVSITAAGRYSRTGQGLHRFVDPVDGETYLYTQYEPADSRRVYPSFDQPDLKAPHRFTITGPARWRLLSNQPEESREPLPDGLVRVRYRPTPPVSTYLTAIAAGPYHRVDDHFSGTCEGQPVEIDLGVLCRASLAEHLDADAIVAVTKQGLRFFHEQFRYRYPWGKYDSIFVPEYNLGAMENPGLVTFTEQYVFRSQATRAQRAGRANTILHEMSHMWFGDLVTPAWWDELWLKESFAEYMGAQASSVATEYSDAWVAFAGARKQGAYVADQLPTTHPIAADIGDLQAAKQNFDRITYAKGAAVLRQLVAFVGTAEFFAGSAAYFRAHAFGAARLPDLLAPLEEASGRDLAAWSRAWLQTSGVDEMVAECAIADGAIERLAIAQSSTDAATGRPAQRPHRLGVGLFVREGERLRRTGEFVVDVLGDGAEVPAAVGAHAADLIVLNDGDLSYVKVRLDERSRETALACLAGLDEPLTRLLLWRSLSDLVRDAQLPAARYVDAVLAHGPAETQSAALTSLLANVLQYLGVTARDAAPATGSVPGRDLAAVRRRVATGAWERLRGAEPGSDQQLLWARLLADVTAVAPEAADRARALLAGEEPVAGLVVDHDLRWRLWASLAALGQADAAELAAERDADGTASGITRYLQAMAARPDAAVKAAVWEELHGVGALSNDHVDALIDGFVQPLAADGLAAFVEPYFSGLEQVWERHSIEIAQRLVRRLFPATAVLEPGQRVADHPFVRAARTWLADDRGPRALRRLIIEGEAGLVRGLTAQAQT